MKMLRLALAALLLAAQPALAAPPFSTSPAPSAAASSVSSSIIPIGSAVACASTGNDANVTSLALAAGEWNVWGNIYLTPTGGSFTFVGGGISTTTDLLPAAEYRTSLLLSFGTGSPQAVPVPFRHLSLGSPTTVYLVERAAYAAGTCTAAGGLHAQRTN